MTKRKNELIQVYELGEFQYFLTDGQTCWDMTPTLGWRALGMFMVELASGQTKDWPMDASEWDEFRKMPENRDMILVAQMDNLGEKNEKITILTAAISGGARDAFTITDFNPNTWRESVTIHMESEQKRRQAQLAENPAN